MAKILTIDDYLTTLTETLEPIGRQLVGILDRGLPGSHGVIWHGHPVWMLGKVPVAAFKAHASHITFMIWRGQELTDRSERLQAAGSSTMANLKVHSVDDIDEPLFINWLNQALRLE